MNDWRAWRFNFRRDSGPFINISDERPLAIAPPDFGAFRVHRLRFAALDAAGAERDTFPTVVIHLTPKVGARGVVVLASSAACLLAAGSAHAAPPGDWSIGVERLFGVRRVTIDTEVEGVTLSTQSTSISLLSTFGPQRGYSSPRLAFDYLAGSSVTFGGAVAYETVSFNGGGDDASTWLFAARVGYFGRPTAALGLWPRAGLTHVSSEFGGGNLSSEFGRASLTATALTLEVPLVFLVLGQGLGLTLMPHADIGIAGGTDTVDQEITELGLQFGLNAFF